MSIRPSARNTVVRCLILVLSCAGPAALAGQVDTSSRIRGCGKEFCQEMVVYGTGLDTLLNLRPCRSRPALVLRTLHSAPFSPRDVRSGAPLWAPRSPVLGRIDDSRDPFSQFAPQVRVVDQDELIRARGRREQCVFIFSPVTWISESLTRLIVLQIDLPESSIVEWYMYFRRSGDGWIVSHLESGFVS